MQIKSLAKRLFDGRAADAGTPSHSGSDTLLHAFDFGLMQSAARWDLRDRAGRKASARWLRDTYELLLRDAIKPELFWELGAFEAAFSRRLRGSLQATIFHAFEANPYNFTKYRDDVARDGVNYHHLALGPKDGSAVFNIGRRLGDRELPPEMGCNSILTKSGDRDYEEVEVAMVSVDSFAAANGLLGKSAAAWVDTEGFAFQVLEGMREALRNCACIFVEVEDRQLWEGQKTAADVKRFLFAEGFVPILRDFEFKQQYNILFARLPVYERADVRLILTEALQAAPVKPAH